MTTFSQMIDKMVTETLRPDLREQVASYLNQTIRELHFKPDTGAALKYRDNFTESQVTATLEVSQTWDIPNPQNFQAIQVVQFASVFHGNETAYASERVPSRTLASEDLYFYRGGSRFVFKGYGGIGGIINIGYYAYPRALKYRAVADRLATWDDDDGWTYADTVITEEDEVAALESHTNWILQRWATMVEEGLRAKIYKRLEQTERARTAYSLYTQLRQGMVTSESDSEAQFV